MSKPNSFSHPGTEIKSVRVERDGMRRIDGDDVYDTDAELDAAEEQAKLEWEAAVKALQTAREKVLDELEAQTDDVSDPNNAYNRFESMGIYCGLPYQLVGANYDEYDSVRGDLRAITRILGSLRVPSAEDARAALEDVKQAFKNCERFKNAGSNEDGLYDKSARRRVTKSAPRWLEQFVERLEVAADELLKAVSILDNNATDEDIDVSDRRDEVVKLYESLDLLAAAVIGGELHSYESDED